MDFTPLHTRMLSLRVTLGSDDDIVAEGRILDLRKRGVVPMIGKLQGPGVVHDMSVRLVIDALALTIKQIQPGMAAFPFTAAASTRGEGCPDRLLDVQKLVGASLRDSFGARLGQDIGGPRGCFHIFTLLRMLGPTIELICDRHRRGSSSPPTAGEPLFSRSLIVDGIKGEGLSILLHGMLCDLHYRFGEELDLAFDANATVQVTLPFMAIAECSARVRRSNTPIADPQGWSDEPTAQRLIGKSLLKGYTAQVQTEYAQTLDLEPLQHLLFMMAPALFQCFPGLTEEMQPRLQRTEGPHAAVDSCHMWRAGGPLVNAAIWGT